MKFFVGIAFILDLVTQYVCDYVNMSFMYILWNFAHALNDNLSNIKESLCIRYLFYSNFNIIDFLLFWGNNFNYILYI